MKHPHEALQSSAWNSYSLSITLQYKNFETKQLQFHKEEMVDIFLV